MEATAKDTKAAKIFLLCRQRPEWCRSSHFSTGPDCFISRVAINHFRIAAAIRRLRAVNTTIVAEQRSRQITRVPEIIRKDPHSVADVRFDVEQVIRRAAPVSRVEWHHLHQPPRAGTAGGPRFQV